MVALGVVIWVQTVIRRILFTQVKQGHKKPDVEEPITVLDRIVTEEVVVVVTSRLAFGVDVVTEER